MAAWLNPVRQTETSSLSLFTKAHLREQDHVADTLGSGEDHDQTVNAHAHSAGRRHAVLHGRQEVLIQLLHIAARLVGEALRKAIGSEPGLRVSGMADSLTQVRPMLSREAAGTPNTVMVTSSLLTHPVLLSV